MASGIEQASLGVRSLARGMVPVPIDRQGLMSALAEPATQTREIYGLRCSFQCPEPIELDNDTEATHLYRIAQEAVGNARRHASPGAIWIRLEQSEGRIVLAVQDNGVGFARGEVRGRGVGLRLMEHRTGMIGGTFSIQPHVGGGTCVTCSVPR